MPIPCIVRDAASEILAEDDSLAENMQRVALLDRLVCEKLQAEAGALTSEGWKWTEVATDLPYGYSHGLRRLSGYPAPMGILVDLSHLNAKGFDDVARVSQGPLVATHSNAHALCPSPRNLTDRQLHMIRERGGMVGLNFATFYLNADGRADTGTSRDTLLRHLDHLITEAGEDHVGLGSDFDGCVLPDLIGDVTGVPKLFEAMGAHGYDAALMAKLARDNWLSCLDRCQKG